MYLGIKVNSPGPTKLYSPTKECGKVHLNKLSKYVPTYSGRTKDWNMELLLQLALCK